MKTILSFFTFLLISCSLSIAQTGAYFVTYKWSTSYPLEVSMLVIDPSGVSTTYQLGPATGANYIDFHEQAHSVVNQIVSQGYCPVTGDEGLTVSFDLGQPSLFQVRTTYFVPCCQ